MSSLSEVREEIEEAVRTHELRWTSASDAVRGLILDRLGLTGHELYPWDATELAKATRPYGDDWSEALREELGFLVDQCILVVSGEEVADEWLIYKGDPSEVEALMSEVQIVEYFVCDTALTKFLFDTHHNELVKVAYEERPKVEA